jgi:pilus assembly protein Flp/PilA
MLQLYVYIRTWLESLKPEDGQDLIEYALLIGLIAIVAIAGILLAGNAISAIWSAIGSTLDSIRGTFGT